MKWYLKITLLRNILLFSYRLKMGLSYLGSRFMVVMSWLFRSRETTNFTYDLEQANKLYMACFISSITGKPYAEIESYIREIENDTALKNHILHFTDLSDEKYKADSVVRYGKRMGWYAIVRAIKPKIVIETGVDKGLGSCVLTAALKKNAEEGQPGYYYGTDINPKAGYLLQSPYLEYGKILYGDSIESLQRFQDKIDIFINDSDHSAEYEANEYVAIKDKLSPNGLILGDNCEVTTKLYEFSIQNKRRFLFFREEPINHWFPGGGIGVSY